MNIQRYENEAELCDKFEADTLSASRVIPGNARNYEELDKQNDFDLMNDFKIKKSLEKTFGNVIFSVSGKTMDAGIMAFSYGEHVILCVSENKEIGTSWYCVDSNIEGSRFGKPMLLSCDKKVKDFWPDFCQSLKNLININMTRKNKFK